MDTLTHLLAKPERISLFEHLKLDVTNLVLLSSSDKEVIVSIERFCYPPISVSTMLITVDGHPKIDSVLTFHNLMQNLESTNRLRKYCYDFNDSVLSGYINGEPWSFKMPYVVDIKLGGKIKRKTFLHPEICDAEFSGMCELPKLILNFDLDGDGGNLSATQNLTIYSPPGNNLVVTEGSYRISRMPENNTTKLELSFKQDDSNYLSGYVVL